MLYNFLIIFGIVLIVLTIDLLAKDTLGETINYKLFLILFISGVIFIFIPFRVLPKTSGYWEEVDVPKNVLIHVDEGYKVVAKKKVSNSKWFWTDNQGVIIYEVRKK